MTLRSRGRRHALAGAGAAALTAAAVFVGPVAAAAPADEVGGAAEAVQEEAQKAIEEAEAALDEAREQAEDAAARGQSEADEAVEEAEAALEDARQQAEQAMEDAEQEAGDAVGEAREQADDAFGDVPRMDAGAWLPDDLRRDLERLQDMPAGERAERLQEIMRSALSGEYGDEVERWGERMGGWLASLPPDLRTDIQNVFGQEPEEARADVRQIMEDAVDGEYGRDVEKAADWLRDTAQRWDLARSIQGVGPGE